MTTPLGGHERIYRGLVRLYPADYGAAYGDQMVQLFADQLRDEGPGRSWLTAMGDIPTSAASEHLRRNRTVAQSLSVAPSPLTRLLGLLGVVGGAVLLIAFAGIPITPDLFNLRLALFNICAIAVVIAVHKRQSAAGRLLALSGAVPAIIANAVYLVIIVRLVAQPGEIGMGDYPPLHGYAQQALWLAGLWFGLVTLRFGVMNKSSALALVLGSGLVFVGTGILVPIRSGTLLETLVLGGFALYGAAWILLGLDVALRRRPAPIEG